MIRSTRIIQYSAGKLIAMHGGTGLAAMWNAKEKRS